MNKRILMIVVIVILVAIIAILLISLFSKTTVETQAKLVEYAESKYCAKESIENIYQHESEEMWTIICKEKKNINIRTQYTLDKYGAIVSQKPAENAIIYP